MFRKTRKYLRGCDALRIPSSAELPHETVYQTLHERGYDWTGEQWQPEPSKPRATAALRISAPPDDLDRLTGALLVYLGHLGAELIGVTGPIESAKDRWSVAYIHFSLKDWT